MLASVMTAVLLASLLIPSNAYANNQITSYGFDLPSSGYSYKTWFNEATIMDTYTENGIVIGTAVAVVARARSNQKDSTNNYYDTLLVRTQMEPRKTKSGSIWYHGMNNVAQAKLKLHNNQSYVNYEPKATMPESSSTWNVSFSGNKSSDKKFGFTLGTGYSSTTKDNAYTVSSNYYSSQKEYDIKYNYRVSANIASTAARKAINKWCTNTHQAFYAFTYRTPSNNTKNMTINYYVSFRYAFNLSQNYDGSTWDVELDSTGRTASYNINYLSSN